MKTPWIWLLGAATICVPLTAYAHGFGRLYNLPVPFWLYGWTAAAVLVLSFLLAAWFARADVASDSIDGAPPEEDRRDISQLPIVRRLRSLLPLARLLSVLLLALCMSTAYFGNPDPYRNFSMTFFWILFLLGFTYLTALVGNIWGLINPWRVIAETLGRILPVLHRGLLRYPPGLGMWPALALYLGFIWFELFGHGRPAPLAQILFFYTLVNLAGPALFGVSAWFRHCEFFSVYLRLVALMSPLDVRPAEEPTERARLYWRRPFSALVRRHPTGLSSVIFVMAMLATTAFDGLRATQAWVSLFWADPTGIVTALAGTRPMTDYALLRPWYIRWETFWLLAMPLLYFGIYMTFTALAKWAGRADRGVRQLALDFAFCLIPIALAYHMTHYATLMLTHGLKILSLASDPFGWGWNLFGTAMHFRAPILPSMGLVWHSQVGLILLGHVLSVYLSHRVALRVFGTRSRAFFGQLPMLLLMILLTLSGLWILAQPLTAERMM